MTEKKLVYFCVFILKKDSKKKKNPTYRPMKNSSCFRKQDIFYGLRMFLVYTETSTMRIGEAGFEQLANMVSIRAPDFVPLTQQSLEKCIFLPQGNVVPNVTNAEK